MADISCANPPAHLTLNVSPQRPFKEVVAGANGAKVIACRRTWSEFRMARYHMLDTTRDAIRIFRK